MEIFIKDQLIACFAFSVLGILLGILYDFFRILCLCIYQDNGQRAENNKACACVVQKVFRFIFDIVFGIIASVTFSVVSYAFSYGQFRLASLVSASIGFAAYISIFGRIVMFFSEKLVRAVKCAIRKILHLIFLPSAALFRLVLRLMRYIYAHTFGALRSRIKSAGNKKHLMLVIEREIPKNVRFD